jgi:hypothetical protein
LDTVKSRIEVGVGSEMNEFWPFISIPVIISDCCSSFSQRAPVRPAGQMQIGGSPSTQLPVTHDSPELLGDRAFSNRPVVHFDPTI